jgi:hypothetical protein
VRAPLPIPVVCTVAIRGSGWSIDIQRFDWSDDVFGGTATDSARRG